MTIPHKTRPDKIRPDQTRPQIRPRYCSLYYDPWLTDATFARIDVSSRLVSSLLFSSLLFYYFSSRLLFSVSSHTNIITWTWVHRILHSEIIPSHYYFEDDLNAQPDQTDKARRDKKKDGQEDQTRRPDQIRSDPFIHQTRPETRLCAPRPRLILIPITSYLT